MSEIYWHCFFFLVFFPEVTVIGMSETAHEKNKWFDVNSLMTSPAADSSRSSTSRATLYILITSRVMRVDVTSQVGG